MSTRSQTDNDTNPSRSVSRVVPMAELKPLMVRSNWPGLWHLGALVLVLVATGYLVIASMETYWLVPAMFVHGVVLVHLFALQHECSHYTVFADRNLCEAIGHICGFVVCVPHQFFRHEHMKHHTHTQIEGEDPQLIPLPKSVWGYLLYVSAIPYWYRQVEGVVRRALGELNDEEKGFVRESVRGAIERESQIYLIGYGLIIASMLVFGWTAPIYLWLLPSLLGQPVMRAIRMAEHVGKPLVTDMLQNTRTTYISWPMRFLCWNMNYHIEHHYAPAVPYHALPALHTMLGQHVVPAHGYFDANRDILRHIKASSVVSA